MDDLQAAYEDANNIGEGISIKRAKELLSQFNEIDEKCTWAIGHRPQSETIVREAFYQEKLHIWAKEGLSELLYIIDDKLRDEEKAAGFCSSFIDSMQAKSHLKWEFLHIFPSHGLFETFRAWVMSKSNYCPTFINENQYWEEIAKRPFPDDFLNEHIRNVEIYLKNVSEWLLIPENKRRERDSMSIGDYKNYCFAKGYDFFTKGEEIDWKLIGQTFYHVELCGSLEDFGNCFYSLYDGIRTGNYRKFLLQQKKRLEDGEEITKATIAAKKEQKPIETATDVMMSELNNFDYNVSTTNYWYFEHNEDYIPLAERVITQLTMTPTDIREPFIRNVSIKHQQLSNFAKVIKMLPYQENMTTFDFLSEVNRMLSQLGRKDILKDVVNGSVNIDVNFSATLHLAFKYKIALANYVLDSMRKILTGNSDELTVTKNGDKYTHDKLTHSQIALLYIYTYKPITKNNAQEIAEKYGQTSGQKLTEKYNKMYASLTERTSSKVAVKDIERVISLLSDPKHLKRAKDELKQAKTLKSID